MKLDELKAAANAYLDGDLIQDGFSDAILEFLESATDDDYHAFALWIVEQGKGKEH